MQNNENVIEVTNVKKKFKVYYDKGRTLKEKALYSNRNKYEERQVLKGISFCIKKGEAVGLIGENGCGKSTTLKLLTRIMYPDEGTVALFGRVSSLLELGAGFHPDLSGRENIYINASIFGLNRKEIDKRMEEIIDFSELEEVIDNPVRTYSSGMYMRLAFSVAINVNADILLIDEILAVGDVNFQAKCFQKLLEIKSAGVTIVLVSHATAQIERICDRSIWIQDGQVRSEGNPVDVHREYMDYMIEQREVSLSKKEIEEQETEPQKKSGKDAGKREGKCEGNQDMCWKQEERVRVVDVRLLDGDMKKKKIFRTGEAIRLEVDLYARECIEDYLIEINLVRADGIFCYGCSTVTDQITCDSWCNEKCIRLFFKEMNLLDGSYHFDLHLAHASGSTIYFGGNIVDFEIDSHGGERGFVYLMHDWMKG